MGRIGALATLCVLVLLLFTLPAHSKTVAPEPTYSASMAHSTKGRIMRVARSYVGTTYHKRTWNCSDYTSTVMYKATGVYIPDDVTQQRFYGRHPSHLKRGDLIFFAEGGGSVPSHVGIYAGHGMLWHNSSYPAFHGVVKSYMMYINGYRPQYTRRIR